MGWCAWCEAPFIARVIRGDTPQFCSTRCKQKMRIRREVNARAGGNLWRWSDFMRMARKFGYRCAYCGEKPDRLDPDHVVPIARGGDDSLSNLLPACLACNSHKRDLLLDEWAQERAARGLDPRATDTTGPQYTHLALRSDVQPRRMRAHAAAA